MDINDVFSLVKYRANKNGYLGSISPDDFNLLFPRAEIRYYNREYAQYAGTERVSDTLSKFKSDPLAITINAQGQYPSPCDMFHVDALLHNFGTGQVEITRVESDRIANNLSSGYDAPDEEFPIYTEQANYLQFYPINLGTANLIYLKKPTTSFWAYTLVGGRPVYNKAGSTQPLWYDTDIDNIIYLLLEDIGISLRDQELESFALTQSKIQI